MWDCDSRSERWIVWMAESVGVVVGERVERRGCEVRREWRRVVGRVCSVER